jgi:hypothetical protein
MQITAKIIKEIVYKSYLKPNLPVVQSQFFDVNAVPAACLYQNEQNVLAVSRWVSPKRTRSYPYERVYNTLSANRRATIIPVIKDEGISGDRDFVQWDTVALMSLLDVYVILAYYADAEKNSKRAGKITKQKFDAAHVNEKIKELNAYFSSALHWNLKELSNISIVVEKARAAQQTIAAKTGVNFHGEKGLEIFAEQTKQTLSSFTKSSRQKAQTAQAREVSTRQPKEILTTATKAKLTISNFLGGLYYFTVDEVKVSSKDVRLIECKHTAKNKLPSVGDVKDGLLKMMLYANLEETMRENILLKSEAVLRLTSGKLIGQISSNANRNDKFNFFKTNQFTKRQINFLRLLFVEAKRNNFTVEIKQI